MARNVEEEMWVARIGGEWREEERGLQGYDRDDKKIIIERVVP